jgi:hypothetical protein
VPRREGPGWLAPLLLCLPCLLLPPAVLGGAAVASALGGVVTEPIPLFAGILLLGVVPAAALLAWHWRRGGARHTCCPPDVDHPEAPHAKRGKGVRS